MLRKTFLLGLVLLIVLTACGGSDKSDSDQSTPSRPILFVSNRDGNNEIYVMNADGSNVKRLTEDAANDSQPTWAPDGKTIAFVSDRAGHSDIYTMNADGSNVTALVQSTGAVMLNPVYSPDGQQVAFEMKDGLNGEIFVMNADGSGLTNLTGSPTIEMDPTWSADGKQIAFVSWRDDGSETPTFEIYVMGADGSNPQPITSTPQDYEYAITWSPDGKRILFVNGYVENNAGLDNFMLMENGNLYLTIGDDFMTITEVTNSLCSIKPDGSDRKCLDVGGLSPSWSPDGKQIAFVPTSNDMTIAVMKSSGSDIRTIMSEATLSDTGNGLTGVKKYDFGPAW